MKIFRSFPKEFRYYTPYLFLFIFFLAYTIIFSCLKIAKYNTFNPTCWDVGWLTSSSWKISTEGNFIWTHSFLNRLFSPQLKYLTPLLQPIYFIKLFLPPIPPILLILHTAVIAFGIFPLYMFTKNILKDTCLSSVFALSYLLHPFTHYATTVGFPLPYITFSCLILAAHYLEKKQLLFALFFISLANTTRINVVILNMLWGIALLFSSKHKAYGKIIFLFNFLWLSTVLGIIFLLKIDHWLISILRVYPASESANFFKTITDKFIKHFFIFLKNPLMRAENFIILLNIFLPFFFMPLFRMSYLFPLIYSLSYIFFIHNYSSEFAYFTAFVYLSAIYGSEIFIHKIKQNKKIAIRFLSLGIIVGSALCHYYFHLYTQSHQGPVPLTNHYFPAYYSSTPHTRIGHKFLEMIPKRSSVVAQHILHQHLIDREELEMFLTYDQQEKWDFSADEKWEYVFLDLLAPRNLFPPPDRELVKKILKEKKYGVLAYEDGWLLLKRGYNSDKNQQMISTINTLPEAENFQEKCNKELIAYKQRR